VKDGGDQLNGLCENWRSVTKSRGEEECAANNKKNGG